MPRIATRPLALCLLFLFSVVPARSEVGHESYDRWLPIPEGPWEAGTYSAEDHAVVLYAGHIMDDSSRKGNCEYHVYRRTLARDRVGADELTTVEITFDDDQSVEDLAARTVKADGTILELKKEDFHEKTLVEFGRERIRAVAFAFRAVDPGDLVEYRYVLHMKADAPPLVYLSDEWPTEAAELTWFPEPVPELDATTKWTYSDYLWQPVYVLGQARPYLVQEVLFPDPENPEGLFLRLEKLPAIAEEDYAPSFGERSATFVGHYRYPNRDEELDFWTRTAAEVGDHVEEFGRKNRALDAWYATVAAEPRELEADLARCLAFIDGKVRCDAYLPPRERSQEVEIQRNVDALLAAKSALAYDLDRLLVAMLDRLGYTSTVFWVRDRTEGPFVREWRSLGQFTGTGVAVRDSSGMRWVYPASGRSDPDGLPWSYLGATAFLARRTNVGENDPFPLHEPIEIPEAARNQRELTISLRPDPDLVARGRLRWELRCPNDVIWAAELASLDEGERSEAVREEVLPGAVRWKGYEETCTVDGLTVAFACSVEVEGIVDDAGGLLLIDLADLRADDFAIEAEGRRSDVEFLYPLRCRTTVNVTCPPGFGVEEVPATARITESFANASIQSLRADAVYRMVRDLEISHCLYVAAAAAPMEEFFGKALAAARSPVVLGRRAEEGQ